MSNVNAVVIEGNLTRDVEVRFIPSGTAVATFAIAVNKRTVQNGEKKESVSYIDIVAWGKQAESCGQYLSKGDHVIVEGSLEQRRWDDRSSGEKRSKLEVVARPFGIHFKSKKKGTGDSGGQQAEPEAPVDEGEIPF